MHLTLVLCARVCFLGALVFQESFGQNIMLNTETSIYEENISKYSNPSWNAENSSFLIKDNSLCLSYMLIHIFYISRVFQLEKSLYPTYNAHWNKKPWTGVNNLFKYFRDSLRTQIKGNIGFMSSNSIREFCGLIALKISSQIFFYQLLFLFAVGA